MAYTQDDLDKLGGLYTGRAWFAHVQLPSGARRLHTGMGPKTVGGHEWEGVSDPFGGQMVGVGTIEEPYFGSAPAVDVVMSGANKAFLKEVWDDRADMEGVSCDLYFATFDPETGDEDVALQKLVPGKISAPRISFIGAAIRFISMKVVSVFEGLNFPDTGSAWSPAGQRQRYAGDKGLDYISADIVEEYKK